MSGRYLVVGAGFSGAVIARELADKEQSHVLVIDQRPHIAGNCYTERDPRTGIMLHKYGPHIFHTNRHDVWQYINHFGVFHSFTNRVKASTSKGVFSLPINLHTINQFFGKNFSPKEAEKFLDSIGDKSIDVPKNFEQQAIKMLGREIYETFFYGYTKKQWGREPAELPASILKRLPVRFNYDDNYYNSVFQGMPEDGYTKIVERILDHPKITVELNFPYSNGIESDFDHMFYTGPIDAFFNYSEGRLGYRTVYWERVDEVGDYQGNAVINYPEINCLYTRVHEHKHFAPWEEHRKTVAFYEYSKETDKSDIPYYPMRLAKDKIILEKYHKKAALLANTSFLGRLATYRYLDMDKVIGEALDFSREFINAKLTNHALPIFPSASIQA